MKIRIEIGENILNFEVSDRTRLSDLIRDFENISDKYDDKKFIASDLNSIFDSGV